METCTYGGRLVETYYRKVEKRCWPCLLKELADICGYEKAEYEIGYIQMEGKGEVSDSEDVKLVNREVRPLAEVPGLDTENPVKQVFTLFYRSTSARRSELKFFVRDNFGREREMTVTFDLESTMAKE